MDDAQRAFAHRMAPQPPQPARPNPEPDRPEPLPGEGDEPLTPIEEGETEEHRPGRAQPRH